jgi:hypothetical protein
VRADLEKENISMDDTVPPVSIPVTYTVTLRLRCAEPDITQNLKDGLEVVLGGAGFDIDALEVREVTEHAPSSPGADVQVTAFSALYLALPPNFQTPQILDMLAERYWHEMGCLQRSVRDPRCIQPALRLYPWRRAGTQWICEFMSWDKNVPVRGRFNFYGHETSGWQNPETGWHGHQGALVFDERDAQVSTHH